MKLVGSLRFAIFALTCSSFLASTVAEQQPPPIRVHIEVVEVPVRVLSGKGKPLRGLQRKDFEIYENGVSQQIRYFEEVDLQRLRATQTSSPRNAQPGPAPVRMTSSELEVLQNRFFIVRFDPELSARELKRSQKAAREFLDNLDFAYDFAAVSWGRFISDFTRDRQRLLELVDLQRPSLLGLMPQTASLPQRTEYGFDETRGVIQPGEGEQDPGRLSNASQLAAPDFQIGGSGGTAAQIGEQVEQLVRRAQVGPLTRQVSRLKHLSGKKVLVHFASGIPNPGPNSRDMGLYDPRIVARVFSDAGFTVYPVNPAGLRARLQNRYVDTLPFARYHGEARQTRTSSLVDFMDERGLQMENMFLKRWSLETGGIAFYNRNDLETGVRNILEDTSHFYYLAYQPASATYDNRFRNITVKTPRIDRAQLRHRGGYFSTVHSTADLLNRTLLTALQFPGQFQDFPVSVQMERARSSLRVDFSFPFDKVPMREFVAFKKAEKITTHFQQIRVFGAVVDDAQRLIDSFEKTYFLNLGEEQLSTLRTQNATLTRELSWGRDSPRWLKIIVVVGQNEQIATYVAAL